MIVITHYQRLLEYIGPDVVHDFVGGRIVKSGDKALARALEDRGYAEFEREAGGGGGAALA
jgi:Fe-S cluster assembly ATP-binding protein